MENKSENKKKFILIIVLIITIVILVLAAQALKYRKVETSVISPVTKSDNALLNQAASADTTASINSNLNSINVDDTSSADLKSVDQELNKL